MYYNSTKCQWANMDDDGWNTVGDPNNACYLYYHYMAKNSLSDNGYVLKDINDDGVPELRVSIMDYVEDGECCDLYTIVGGQIQHVISAGERDYFSLCTDGSIDHSGSLGAAYSFQKNCVLNPQTGNLVVRQALIDEDDENYYFDGRNAAVDADVLSQDMYQAVTKEESSKLSRSFPQSMKLELISFDEYQAG